MSEAEIDIIKGQANSVCPRCQECAVVSRCGLGSMIYECGTCGWSEVDVDTWEPDDRAQDEP